MSTVRRLLVLVIAAAALVVPSAAHAAIVTNGDFETGNLSGWQTNILNQPGPSAWEVYTGTLTSNTFPVSPPRQGTHAAVSVQQNVSRQILYQDVIVPPGGSVNQLDLTAYYRNTAPGFASPDTLRITPGPNQQYRIDVMKPSAAIDSVASADVLLNLLRTRAGDPNTLAPTQLTANLSAFAGQTLRLRFAVVTSQAELNASVDAVAIKSNGFSVGQATRNKKKGTAKVPLTLPDAGDLTVSGNGVKGSVASASSAAAVGAGPVKVLIKAKGKKKRKLNSTGKVKVSLTLTYTPTGLGSSSQSLKLKLKKKI